MNWKDIDITWRAFCARGLNKPGTFIKVKGRRDDGSMNYYDSKPLLIGDINELGGICDDCTEFKERDMIVISYAVIDLINL
jgi:hypothetical protein